MSKDAKCYGKTRATMSAGFIRKTFIFGGKGV